MSSFTFGFRKQFEAPILDGVKAQTIRPNRKDGKVPKPGDRLKLFTGMRTPQCKALGIAEVFDCFPVYIDLERGDQLVVTVRGLRLNPRELTEFAQRDGFRSSIEMLNWFRETYLGEKSFHGFCVCWHNLRSGPRRVVK